jgi:hypothetical protein
MGRGWHVEQRYQRCQNSRPKLKDHFCFGVNVVKKARLTSVIGVKTSRRQLYRQPLP